MFEAFGWIIISSSLTVFTDDMPLEKIDKLDDQVNLKNQQLFQNLRQYIVDHEDVMFKWHLL